MATDLFSRLAQRALAEATPSLRAEREPGPGRGDDEPVITLVEPEATESVPVTGVSTVVDRPGTPPIGDPGPRGPAGQAAPHRPELVRLVPVPPMIPPARHSPAPAATSVAAQAPALDGRTTTDPSAPTEPAQHAVLDPPPHVTDRVLHRAPVLRPAPPTGSPPTAPIRPQVDPPSPPVVEVTVGRLEIRVRPPSIGGRTTAPHRDHTPAPALTLEQYLRSREATP